MKKIFKFVLLEILLFVVLFVLVLVVSPFYYKYRENQQYTTFPRSVIVGVKIDPPFQTEGSLSPDQQKQQRENISRTIDTVTRDLEESGHSTSVPVTYSKYRFIPFFAIGVNKKGYQFLKTHPLVSGIEENSLSRTAN